jgi:hypothetical protein
MSFFRFTGKCRAISVGGAGIRSLYHYDRNTQQPWLTSLASYNWRITHILTRHLFLSCLEVNLMVYLKLNILYTCTVYMASLGLVHTMHVTSFPRACTPSNAVSDGGRQWTMDVTLLPSTLANRKLAKSSRTERKCHRKSTTWGEVLQA